MKYSNYAFKEQVKKRKQYESISLPGNKFTTLKNAIFDKHHVFGL
jgi:hypothetical protein